MAFKRSAVRLRSPPPLKSRVRGSGHFGRSHFVPHLYPNPELCPRPGWPCARTHPPDTPPRRWSRAAGARSDPRSVTAACVHSLGDDFHGDAGPARAAPCGSVRCGELSTPSTVREFTQGDVDVLNEPSNVAAVELFVAGASALQRL